MTRRTALSRLAAAPFVVLVVALVVPGSVVARPAATRAGDARPAAARLTEAPDAATAVSLARAQGARVEVVSQRTETRSVFAEPRGTMTAELHARPVRVRRGGSWAAVDTALVRRADGSVGPRTAAVDLSFPGDDAAAPVIRHGRAGKWVELSWPGRLPAPALAGSTATYPGVLPGVDLVLRADPDGFAQFLVVKDARAARNPALAKVRLGLRAHGVRVRATRSGALEARDARGGVVFAAPVSRMWDSGATRRQAKVGVTVEAGSLWLRPDRGLLTDPATVFPVTVDPVWTTLGPYAWTKAFSGKPTTSYYNGCCDVDGWAKVGQCWNGQGECNGLGEAWSYFQFDTQFLGGKRILSATLTAKLVYSPSPDAKYHSLYLADGTIGPGTTWNNRPQGAHLSNSLVPCAGRSGCAPTVDVPFVAGTFVRAGGISTYFLKASDSGDQLAWRKYDAWATRLTINYNTAPNLPSDLSTDPPLRPACRWCDGKRYVGDQGIRLRARLSDPDGDQVKPVWRVYYNGALQPEDPGTYKPSGELHDYPIDLTNRHNQTVGWELYASDGTDTRGYASGTAFEVDRLPPGAKPDVSGVLYREDNRWHGGVGVPDTFTFGAAGVGDVDHFLYGWQDPPTTKVDADALGGKATVTLTPPGDGPRDLYVQSVDRAGNRSLPRVFHFYVRAGSGPLAQWSFDGNAGDSAFLGDRDGTLWGNPTYRPGAVGSAIQLDGTTQHVSAPNTIRTDASFSVAAWVRLERGDVARAVVSQDGYNYAGLDLWYRPDNGGRWVFGMANADSGLPGTDMASSAAPAQLNTWTHLTGVYDATSRQLRLYVNGALSGTGSRTVAGWDAPGTLRIGRTLWVGSLTDSWQGSIDEVQAYDRVLSPAEVAAVVGRDNVQVGQWKLDELGGTTAGNAVEGGEMLVLRNGASFTGDSNADGKSDGGAVGGAVRLDGVDDEATTSGPVVRTDQSFTVAAWVRVDRLAQPSTAQTIVSQDGTAGSGFLLQQRDTGWSFVMPDADTPGSWPVWAQSPPNLATANTWAHVAGVYDAAAGQGRLYVNGQLVASDAGTVSWTATGPLAIGRTRLSGSGRDRLPGRVDEVRVYSRVLSAAEIQGIVSRDDVALGVWRLDGNASDASGNGRHGTVSGTPDWVGGQRAVPDPTDLAVRLDGVDDAVSLPHTVDARRSFAVTAWARLDAAGGLRTVLSQDGSRVSAFKLRATAEGRWSFVMFDQDVDGGAGRAEVVGGAAQVGAWTHLVAVYDAAAGRMSLYVNGVLAGTADHAHAWDYATGGLQVGRARWNGGAAEWFPGAVDDVAVYGRVLFADEIRVLAGRDLTLAHNWTLDEGSGSTAADEVGDRPGTLAGGASRVPGRLGNAVGFDGVNGRVSTTGVDLRTDDSFSVSAWVYLSDTCDPGAEWSCKVVAVSVDGVDGAGNSKFRLGHVTDQDQFPFHEGLWVFEMPESGAPDAPVTKAAVSLLPSDFDTWVHLAGVYDKPSGKLWLYVNGTRKGDGTLQSPWQAGGGLQIGRGRNAAGSAGQYFNGRVDDVRLYRGPLDDDRISNLYHSYPAQGGTPSLPTADVGYWKFDENTGTTAADSAGRGLTATLRGSAGWLAGGRNQSGAWLDGTSGYAETAGPVLDTTRSFSVAAWAYRTQGGVNRTVVAQDGNQVSSFLLQYHPASDRWRVVVPGVDRNDPPSVLLTSTEPAPLGRWTHLALAYDATLRQLRLYVNGRLSAAQVGVTVLDAGGKLSIGRARWNGGNVDYFPGGIDDVRAFGKALSDGEVRKVYDDVYAASYGFWRFDDQTVRDSSWRGNPTTATGAVSYTGGVSGQALQLDGVSASATAQSLGAFTSDSLTVSAWAKLTRNDRVQTVLAQDGTRMSGFMLQYRPNLDRWVFAAPAQDADGAELVYAHSPQPAVLNRWVHLAGVYDHAAAQLRLYVNGEMVGSRNGVTLWAADGGFTIGRGKYNGVPAEFFTGLVDEVRVEQGMATDDQIALRAGYPAPAPGQLGTFVNPATGDHYTGKTDDPVRPGYRFERSLGTPVAAQGPNTRMLYACQVWTEFYTSTDPGCEGFSRIGEVGLVFTQPPTNLPTVPIYRCRSAADLFESLESNCPGATNDGLLGYAIANAPLPRYYSPDGLDHWTTIFATPPGYRYEGSLGWLSMIHQAGTQPLLSCRDGVDEFTSLNPGCEGKQVLANLGEIWTTPPAGLASAPIYRCLVNGERYTSRSATCDGNTVDRQLGYLLTAVPTTPPQFP